MRSESVSPGIGSAQAGELLTSLGAVTSARRLRLATAAHQLPGFYVAVGGRAVGIVPDGGGSVVRFP